MLNVIGPSFIGLQNRPKIGGGGTLITFGLKKFIKKDKNNNWLTFVCKESGAYKCSNLQ